MGITGAVDLLLVRFLLSRGPVSPSTYNVLLVTFIGGIALIISGISLIVIGIRNPSPPPKVLAPVKDDVFSSINENLTSRPYVISIPHIGLKYLLEIFLGFLGGMMSFVFALGLFYIAKNELYGDDASLQSQVLGSIMLMALFALGLFLIFNVTRNSMIERQLYRSSAGKEIIVASEHLKFSIGLFEGEGRNELRKSMTPYRNFGWNQIFEFKVLPARGQGRQHRPAYYRIKVTESQNDYHILRKLSKNEEVKFLDQCRQYLKCNIVIEDENL